MASTDVEDDDNKNILYDLDVCAEWKQENEVFRQAVVKNVSTIGRITSSTQRKGWTMLRQMGLPIQTASPCNLPADLVKLVNCTINWHIAVSRDGTLVAVMQDQYVEIRSDRDHFSSVCGRAMLQRDPHPQWRHMVWSENGVMLACSHSNGSVEVFDRAGTQLFTIATHESSQGYVSSDLSEAVASMVFYDTTDQQWPSELLIIKYHGKLSCYQVERDRGCQLKHDFYFNKHYPTGVSCLVYEKEAGLLFVGGPNFGDEDVSLATREGLTAWRVLSDNPHYKLVTDYAEDLSKAKSQSFTRRLKRRMWSRADNQDGVYRLSLSPDGKFVTSLHYSGKLSIWTAPGLMLHKSWIHTEQAYSEDLSPDLMENPQLRKQVKDLVNTRCLLDVSWWSSEAVILARGTGAVTVSSINTMVNLLGNQPEWFEPAPRLSEVHNGAFLGLEVECRLPQKRRLLSASDDNEEESDEEDAGMMTRSWGLAKQCLHYITDADRFKPPKKKPKLVNRTYRLVCLKSTTPEELFERKLENEEYGEAKVLAQKYGLDVDRVYQRQWKKAPVEIASIQDYLSRISKRSWVLHECMERMSDKIDAMKELLEFGLRGTDLPLLIMIGKGEDKGRFILCDPEDGLYEDLELDDFDPELEEKKQQLKQDRIDKLVQQVNWSNLTLEQRELCRARKKLLQYLYRLKTYEDILGGVNAAERYDPKFFEKFRSQNIVQTAIQYAQSSDWKALETLFTYHGPELLPHRLAILSNFPETTAPSEYKILLPDIIDDEVSTWPVDSWTSSPDWIEQEPCRAALTLSQEDAGDFLYDECSDLRPFRGEATPAMLSQWYEYRSMEIERLSRQADSALELIKLAMERSVQGLDHVLDDMVTMEMLVYSCHIEESLTFKQLQAMTDYDKLELLMSKSTNEMYSKNLRKWLVPFLRQCERRSSGTYIRLLRDYVITMATTDLMRPLQVFEASKTHLPSPVIPKQADLMSLAIDAIYSCQRDDQLPVAMEILQCLPQRGYGVETKEVQRLHTEVDKLERHLNAARVLEENGIKKPIFYIRDSQNNGDEGEQLMIRLTRRLGQRDGTVTEAQWSRLHEEMMQLQDKVYRCVSPALCHEIFVESLLCSGNASYIQLAGRMVERTESESHKPTPLIYNMQTRVPYHKSITLILEAAREYFNSSANLTDSCIGLARSCLNLIQDSPGQIQEELDLINSLAVLDDFGASVLPLQVRLSKDRLKLVDQAINTKPGAYKQQQKLLRLGHLLRLPDSEMDSRDGKVLHLIARAALKGEDYATCLGVCEELIEKSHGAAWDVCVDLSQQQDFNNLQAKMTLLSFAVTFCTPDMIEPILQAKALLETQVLFEGINSRVPDDAEENQSRISPFSAKAALEQTTTILSSTKQTTRAVLSTVTDTKWWQGTVKKLRQPIGRQMSHDLTDRNKKLEHQGCHPFYEGFIDHCYSNEGEEDFRHLDNLEPWVSMETQMGEKLLRTAMLEQMLTECEQTQPATEVLLQLANEAFPLDSTLSLSYLLALQDPLEAEKCFSEHARTDVSLQLALYYYVLQLYTAVRPLDLDTMSPLYLRDPAKLMQKVTNVVCRRTEFDWPENVVALVTKVKHYNEMLADYRQAKVLQTLGRGINIERFTSDPEYKLETILGLAMSLEENIYTISVSLAERYEIPLWQVYAAHLEFLFTDSGLGIEEMQTQVNKLEILDTLRSQPEEFCDRMTAYVYPSLDGTDLPMLIYYYTTLQGCSKPLEGGLSADAHVKLLKKLRPVAAGLDYKHLMESPGQVIDILAPCLSASSVPTFAKLAKFIPNETGGTLDASIIYCTWAVKYFWEGDGKKQPETASAWVHRYEACGEHVQKLQADHIPKFLQAVLYSEKAFTLLEVECRQEICKRMLKYCRQQASKIKKADEKMKALWESSVTVVNGYQQHLMTLSHPVVMTIAESQVKQVQVYYDTYNRCMGDEERVYQMLVSMVLDGELPLEGVSEVLGAIKGPFTLKSLVRDAIQYLLQGLSNQQVTITPLSEVEPLVAMETIVKNIQEYIEDGGELITSEQILAQLRPFCADATINVQPRLDVLHILEKSFKLSDDDCVLLTLYRTQAILTDVWPQYKVSESEIASPDSRQRLFSTLLEKSIQGKGDNDERVKESSALCNLLKLWPPFPENRDDRPWLVLLQAMVSSGCHGNITLVLDNVKSTDVKLSFQEVMSLYEGMVAGQFNLEAVKLVLLTGEKKLFPQAVDNLAHLPQISEDSELIDLLLKHHLVVRLVSSPHYPIIIQYLLANQETEPGSHDYRSVQRLAEELKRAGFLVEAGSLVFQVKSTPQTLQTFGSALGAISKWFK